MSQIVASGGESPPKGWVRDGILSFLSRAPGTVTEIAKDLGVSKATISYHTKALIRRDMIEIRDIKIIRGGVYSKTYALKGSGPPLVRRKGQQEGALANLEEIFERLLMSWHLEPKRGSPDEMEIFLYHLFRILAGSDSLDEQIFEDFGSRVGSLLISSSLKFSSMKEGLKELTEYLAKQEMAQMTAEIRKGEDPKLICMGCFQNKDHGSLVCSFTKGILTGVIRAKRGGRLRVDWLSQGKEMEQGGPGCVFAVRARGMRT